MFLLIGLGNPGSTYERHRHNVGFRALDKIAETYDCSSFAKKDKVLLAEGTIDNNKVLLIKPQSYMNVSGPPVVPFLRFHKIHLNQCIVFHDELDLPFCKVKAKVGGGHGGHNGLRSLDQHIGNAYVRVRLGIGRPPEREMVSPYVLSNFTLEEENTMDALLKDVARYLPLLLAGDAGLFMTRLSPPPANQKEK